MHIHVSHPEGEAKFWLRPAIELARNIALNSSKTKDAERIVESRQQEITNAWNNHFGCLSHKWVQLFRPTADHLYWPDLDVELSVESIRNPACFPLKAK
jgi:hypothetical protein